MTKQGSKMPKLPIIDSLRQRWERSIPSDILKAGPILNFREGELAILTYTSAADKMKVFSAFIREGLENGDTVAYNYPDEEGETVRAKLKEHGIDVEKYEKDDTLYMESLSEYFTSNGKFDLENAVIKGLKWWAEMKRKDTSTQEASKTLATFLLLMVNGRNTLQNIS